MDITVLVIPVDIMEDISTRVLQDYDYKKGQEIVGGLIQPLDLEPIRSTIWCNEEGHMLGLPLNRRATAFLYAMAPEHRGFNVLMGDCYLTGEPDEDGNTTSVPEDVVQTLMR